MIKSIGPVFIAAFVAGLVACDSGYEAIDPGSDAAPVAEPAQAEAAALAPEAFSIAPGLSARTLKNGYGRAAEVGDLAEVHYTGWLYDETATGKRGAKFDSSVDRGTRFQFPLGAGRVIKGWDQGVVGMLIGEKRELTIAPEMAYGDRGAGAVIPPGATLIFEVELFRLEGPADAVE
ncbi:MAG TPA: FKBP-type peptidyl-prolyl cis-trans isomerase [Woeseiaceae bacterium]|nr:FKBP-type peptidyl-prolyl cis-trans isomerase [Woeseiaceae bacterium]